MSQIRLTYQLLQPLSAGNATVRFNFAAVQPLTGGYPNVRGNYFANQPLIGGYSSVLVNLFLVQALFPAAEDLPVSTVPFPGFGNSVANPAIPAAADPASTSLPGLSFSVHKRPMFKTNIQEAASGVEIRNALADYPRWEFELTYEYLEDKTGAESSLKTIMGFFLARQGSFDSWLFKDPDDYKVVNGYCGEADGVTPQFPFCRTMGEFHEKVGQVDTANDINVYLDGVLVDPADYTVTLPNLIIFDSAPPAGTVTADFQFFYACRFIEDEMDFEKWNDKLWSLQSCEFRSIIQ